MPGSRLRVFSPRRGFDWIASFSRFTQQPKCRSALIPPCDAGLATLGHDYRGNAGDQQNKADYRNRNPDFLYPVQFVHGELLPLTTLD
jgi:hypothetical protein